MTAPTPPPCIGGVRGADRERPPPGMVAAAEQETTTLAKNSTGSPPRSKPYSSRAGRTSKPSPTCTGACVLKKVLQQRCLVQSPSSAWPSRPMAKTTYRAFRSRLLTGRRGPSSARSPAGLAADDDPVTNFLAPPLLRLRSGGRSAGRPGPPRIPLRIFPGRPAGHLPVSRHDVYLMEIHQHGPLLPQQPRAQATRRWLHAGITAVMLVPGDAVGMALLTRTPDTTSGTEPAPSVAAVNPASDLVVALSQRPAVNSPRDATRAVVCLHQWSTPDRGTRAAASIPEEPEPRTWLTRRASISAARTALMSAALAVTAAPDAGPAPQRDQP
jgi:hypothetical protein